MADVTSEAAEQGLARCLDTETLDHLHAVGELPLTEISGRTVTIEGKAMSALGWSTAILAFLLSGEAWQSPKGSWQNAVIFMTGLGTAAAMASAVTAYLAVRVRGGWSWPSQSDWLQFGLLNEPARLRHYHLVAMLEAHGKHSELNHQKAEWLTWSQSALVWAAVLLGLGLLARVIGVLVTGAVVGQ